METLFGELDEAALTKNELITGSDEWNTCYATEWFYNGELARRDVHVVVHKLPEVFPTTEM